MSKQNPVPNRTYKSTIFIRLMEDKRKLLEVYNAVSGNNYTDPDLLTINTLENAIYMSVKNDVSFLIDSRLYLYEHQSTYSPNLPLRLLLYLGDLYAGMTENKNLYGRKLVKIPPPQFLILYNGEEELPDRKILRLSDMYAVEEAEHKLELEAVMLNINAGHSPELLSVCSILWEYAEYTARVRKYAEKHSIEDAVERAIEECIEEGILEEFLRKNRAEAKNMSIYEYNQEKHLRQEREAEKTRREENMAIPADFDYDNIDGISSESREKLKAVRPMSLGQAGRISGVRVSDIAVLAVAIRSRRG